jgi:predicted nucleic acid-binding protein
LIAAMVLYLDTSALVKLFVSETHSQRLRRAVLAARLVATHAIAYVEACAAFARLAHARGDGALLAALRRHLDRQWVAWEVVGVTEPLLQRAADLAGRYRLRGDDSVHLAAAESVFASFRGSLPFHFAVFDDQLSEAARRADLPLLDG